MSNNDILSEWVLSCSSNASKLFHHLQNFFRLLVANLESRQLEVNFSIYKFRNILQSQKASFFSFCIWVNFLAIMPITFLKFSTPILFAIGFSTKRINVISEDPIDQRNICFNPWFISFYSNKQCLGGSPNKEITPLGSSKRRECYHTRELE